MTPNQWSRKVGGVIREYRRGIDLEHAHGLEDELLWEYVKDRANEGEPFAQRLLRLDRHPRTRWYA